jgi:hypothetical protein
MLKAAPGADFSHFITGYDFNGGATTDGFHLLRRNCVRFTTTDTWTAADDGTDFDWGTKAADGDFCLELWLYLDSATTAIANLMKRGDETSDGWKLEITSGKLVKFTAHDSSDSVTQTGTTILRTGQWYFICVTVDRSSATGLKLYVNGVVEVASAGSADPTSLALTLDGGTTVVSTGTSGKTSYLGPVGMYIGSSAVQSAATILSHYNEGVGRKYDGSETGLVVAWNNDEGIGTTCYDILGDDNNKVTVSGTEWPPFVRSGATAGDTVSWNPKANEEDDEMDAIGKITAGIGTALSGTAATFPHAIKVGRGLPLNVLETDGAFDLVLFGYTDHF